jgi:hypothetical protein
VDVPGGQGNFESGIVGLHAFRFEKVPPCLWTKILSSPLGGDFWSMLLIRWEK